MTSEDKNSTLGNIRQIQPVLTLQGLAASFGDLDDSTLLYEGLTVGTALYEFPLCLEALKQVLEDSERFIWTLLPIGYTSGIDGTYRNLNNLSFSLLNAYQNGSISNFGRYILDVLSYCITFNIWFPNPQKSKTNINGERQLQDALSKVKSLERKYNDASQEFSTRYTELKSKHSTLISDLETLQNRLTETQKYRDNIYNLSIEADTLTNNAKVSKADIESYGDTARALLGELKQMKNDESAAFEIELNKSKHTLKDIENELIQMQLQQTQLSELVNQAKEVTAATLSREKEITGLLGRAADASLGYQFKRRKEFLMWSSLVWLILIVATIVGVYFYARDVVFSHLQIEQSTQNKLIIEAISLSDAIFALLKSIPVFFVLNFLFSQYRKERNLHEEYAFKANIALSTRAYADLLKKEANEGEEERVNLIKKSLAEVYTQPKVHADNNPPLVSINAKAVSDSLKELTGMIKTLSETQKQ